MDPAIIIGIVSAASQFADLSFTILRSLSQLFTDVKDCPAQALQLRSEMTTLYGLVSELKLTLDTIPGSISILHIASLHDALTGSVTTLKEIIQKINELSELDKTTGIRRLAWPFRNKQIDQHIRRIQGFKSTLSLALQTEQRYSPCPVV